MPVVTPDSSGNNNHGKLIGGSVGNARPTLVASPFAGFGNALSFDGVDRLSTFQAVDCGTSAALDVSNAFCLEVKVQTGSAVTASGAVIAGRYTSAPSQQPVLYISGAAPQRFTIQTINSVEIKGTTTPQPNTKYDVAATYDGTTIRLFVNGVLEASAASGPCTASSNTRFLIGADDDVSGHGAPFPGTIDEVRLSKVARYTANYTPATTPFTADANTLGLWHLDTLSGRAPQPRVFRSTQTAPNAGNVRDLAATDGTATNTATVAAFSGATGPNTILFVPNAAPNYNTVVPSSGAASNGAGWRDTTAENASEQITYAPGTWSLRTRLAKSGQTIATDITVRITAIVYWVTTGGVSTEIGRTTMPDTVISTADYVVAGSFTTASPVVVTAGGKLQTEVYVQPILAGVVAAPATAVNVIFYTDVPMASTPAEFTAIPDYTIQFARSSADVAPASTQLATRGVATSRAASDAAPASGLAYRGIAYQRGAADVAPASTQSARGTLFAPRTATDGYPTAVDTASRLVTQLRTVADMAPASTQAASRTVISARSAADVAPLSGDSASRAIIFARNARHYFVPTDPPVVIPSRQIAGVVRDGHTTQPFLGGATVELVRDSDGLVCGVQTSSTVDGSYLFVRDQYDIETYSVRAFATVQGLPQQDITRSGLVPV